MLGFSALQLSHAGAGTTLDRLASEGRATTPLRTVILPGDAVDQAALGHLHANCGHCHRPYRKRADRELSVYFWQESESLATVRVRQVMPPAEVQALGKQDLEVVRSWISNCKN